MGGLLPAKSVKRFVTVSLPDSFRSHNVLVLVRLQDRLISNRLALFGFETDDHGVEGFHEILNGVIDASIRKRSRDHGEQIIDYHLGQVKDLGVLLVRSEQVPVELGGEVS